MENRVKVALMAVYIVVWASALLGGYLWGKQGADRWWKAQPARIVTRIEYREGPAQRIYVGKDGEDYDAVLRGWNVNYDTGPSPCISLGSSKQRVLIENVWFIPSKKSQNCELSVGRFNRK